MTRKRNEVAADAVRRLERAYGLFGGAERETSIAALSSQLDVTISTMRADTVLWQSLGIMTTRSVFELRNQRVFYKFEVELSEAKTRLRAHFESGKGLYAYKTKTKKAILANATIGSRGHEKLTPVNETVAIVGEDAPKPLEALRSTRLDEPEGLLEAARQYATRADAVARKAAELEQLGITIDHDAFRQAIKLDTDPVLEAVSGLLPHVDRLNRANERLSTENSEMRNELREKRRETEVMRSELNNQRAANKRLSERNIALADAARGTVSDNIARA